MKYGDNNFVRYSGLELARVAWVPGTHQNSEHHLSPQVRLKMNDKKPSKFQFYFSGVLEAFLMLKVS